MVKVNLIGKFVGIKCELAQMLSQESGGRVLNTYSVCGLVGVYGHTENYASRSDVTSATRKMALERTWTHMKVNSICLGFIETLIRKLRNYAAPDLSGWLGSIAEIGRKAQTSESAETTLLLLDRLSYLTGIALLLSDRSTAR